MGNVNRQSIQEPLSGRALVGGVAGATAGLVTVAYVRVAVATGSSRPLTVGLALGA